MIEEYSKKFREITGINEAIVSTVDHVYASMPVRLIDSHNILSKLGDVKILIWDSIYPKVKKSRTDLVLDSGIFAPTDSKYFIFPVDQLEGKSLTLRPNFDEQLENLEKCLDLILNCSKYKKTVFKKIYLDRFREMARIYNNILQENNDIKSSKFYKRLVVETYIYFGFNSLAKFYNEHSQSLIDTLIINEFVPWLIENSKNTPFSIYNLINQSSLIAPPYFTYVDRSEIINQFLPEKADEITKALKAGILLPCKEIIFWAFALSGIKHFGRDFKFFAMLEDFYKIKYNLETDFSSLQLTVDKDDGSFYIQFERDISYRLLSVNGKFKAKKLPIPQKATSISTIPSVYMHIGNRFKEVYDNFLKQKTINFIKMGEIKT